MRRARPGSAAALPSARWWALRAARSRKPATYRCPFCGRYLLAATDHVLIAPEGDPTGRRHAHLECVRAARAAGRLPTRDEWRRASGGVAEERGWRRVWRRGKP